MQCQSCGYPLWNLEARACPECGEPFAPSDFTFMANAVRFCCPHCDQAYYGTGVQGHLTPRSFACVDCGTAIDMDQTIVRPREDVDLPANTVVEDMPWLDRRDRSFFHRLFATIGFGMTNPFRVMRATPSGSSLASAFGFVLIVQLLGLLLGIVLPVAGLMLLQAPSFMNIAMGTALGLSIAVIVLWVLILVWGAVAHLVLRISGGTAHSIGRTYQAICYSFAPCILIAVPCLGPYMMSWLTTVWWIICAILMVYEGQKVSGWRAACAVLLVPAVILIAFIAAYVAFIAALANA
jgi:hypothetical protein